MFTNRHRKAVLAELTKYCQAIRAKRVVTYESQGELVAPGVRPAVYSFGQAPVREDLDLREVSPIVRRIYR